MIPPRKKFPRHVEEKLQFGSGGAWRAVSHDMRSVDVADAIYPAGRQVDFAYWQNRALASVKDHGAGSDIADYDYIGGRVLKRTMQNGVNLDFENGSGTYYDSLGRPTTWKHVKSGTVKIGFDLTYDRAGNPTAISLQHDTAKGSFSSIGYDSANRLLSSTHAGAWSGQPLAEDWTLDGVGNMKDVDGYTTGSRLTTSFNEYYSVAGATNTQDDNGNLTSDGTLTYKWDAFNRLSEVKNGGTTVADYDYDAEGRRVAKVVSGTTTCYSLDGWREIAEYTGTGASYPDREFIFGSFIDEPLVLDSNDSFDSICTGTGDNRYYYQQNWQYSVCALTNGSGTVVEGYEYEPYGHHRVFYHSGSAIGFTASDTIADLGTSHYGNPFLYTGRRYDPETGLQYSRRRYYSQSQQRFISRDPIGPSDLEVESSLFGYVDCNPIVETDPFGLFGIDWWGPIPVAIYDDPPNVSEAWRRLYLKDPAKAEALRDEMYKATITNVAAQFAVAGAQLTEVTEDMVLNALLGTFAKEGIEGAACGVKILEKLPSKIKEKEARELASMWGKGTFDSVGELIVHAWKGHAEEGADLWKYLRKAKAFNKKGAELSTKVLSDGRVQKTWLRKSGEYLQEVEGKIVSYGKNK